MTVEAAQGALDRARQELREVEKQIKHTEAEIVRFREKESVNTADVVQHENAQRRMPRLQKDLVESQEAVSAAEAALAAATRERDLCALSEVRGRVVPVREKLAAIAARLADDPSPDQATWNAVHDPEFVKDLRTSIAALQAHLSRWQPGPSLTPEDGIVDPGPWGSYDGGDGFPLFAALHDRVREVLAARDTERLAAEEEAQRIERERVEGERRAETERREAERRSLEPQLIPNGDGGYRWHYTSEAARKIHVPAERIQLARTDPHRAIAECDARMIALISAKDRKAREALRQAAERNACGRALSLAPPTHSRDLLDEGTRIEMDHRPDLLGQ